MAGDIFRASINFRKYKVVYLYYPEPNCEIEEYFLSQVDGVLSKKGTGLKSNALLIILRQGENNAPQLAHFRKTGEKKIHLLGIETEDEPRTYTLYKYQTRSRMAGSGPSCGYPADSKKAPEVLQGIPASPGGVTAMALRIKGVESLPPLSVGPYVLIRQDAGDDTIKLFNLDYVATRQIVGVATVEAGNLASGYALEIIWYSLCRWIRQTRFFIR